MKRKTISLLLALALLFALAPQLTLTANAAASGKCGDNLTWSFDSSSGTLTISGYGEMYIFETTIYVDEPNEPYYYSEAPWFGFAEQITEIRLPDGLDYIDDSALWGCSNLKSIFIPRNVSYIWGALFDRCTSLNEITVDPANANYTSVDGVLYSKNKDSLVRYPRGKTGSYLIPDSVTEIGSYAFSGCSGLQSVTIPDSVTIISDCAFRDCTSLQSVTIPNSVTEIRWNAFEGCSRFQSIVIPNSVTLIYGEAFYRCSNLANISISDRLEYLGEYAFRDTAYAKNPNKWSDGLLYLGKWLIACQYGITNASIRPGTIGIASMVFTLDTLESVTIPEGLKYICDGAFVTCENLSSVNLPTSIKCIGQYAFSYTAIHDDPNRWDHGLLYIGNWLIEAEENTIVANVRPGTVGIADEALDSLTTVVTLPEGLRYIGEGAFSSMYNLRNIAIPDSVESIGPWAFEDCINLKSISIPNRVTTISEGAFKGCTNLTEVTIPDSVTSIGDYAFIVCQNLTHIRIPDSITSIGVAAFYGCDNLISVVIPQSVTSIDDGAFGIWNYGRDSILILNKDCEIYENTSTLGAPDKTTIYGYPGSTAEAYAEKYGYTFKNVEEVSFIDVADDVYYTLPVAWAVEKGVTNGTAPYIFSPENTCTRAQVVTFLWRAAGSPEPTSGANPFVDVKSDAYYYKAVLWAVENGITTGTSADKFSPNSACTRAQVVTFLWRAEGKPAPVSTANPFKDVNPSEYYGQAVLWAVENGVTTGSSADRFSPASTCTRAQIVTFLYRDMAEKTDFDNISKDKKVVVGITDFPPMDYQDENGAWTGFDAELARAIFRKLGLECKFVEIDWDEKILELNYGSIDCVWNGLTLTDEIRSVMECSQPYVENAQVVVMKRDHPAASGATEESIANLTFAVEAGSAGEAAAKDREYANVTSLAAQSNALLEVESGTADACIIDLTMANAMTGAGTSYADLTSVLKLDKEEYVVGFRKGSDVPAMVNKLLDEMKADGSLQALADKYGLVLSE